MAWIQLPPKAQGLRLKLLTVSPEEAMRLGLAAIFVRLDAGQPMSDDVEAEVLRIVRRERPALHGCILEAIDFSVSTREFELLVFDPSFDSGPLGAEIYREPLVLRT